MLDLIPHALADNAFVSETCSATGQAWLDYAIGTIATASVVANFRSKMPLWLGRVVDLLAANFWMFLKTNPPPPLPQQKETP